MFKRVPGTRDILPDQAPVWQHIEGVSRRIFSLHNYREIRPPLIEEASLFTRSLGEGAEIVRKQMFEIRREHDLYALRPEGTAPVVRAYLENNLDRQKGFVKLYYLGPMFRAERPQKGRLRQFHHIGCEAIGSYGPEIDIEVICLANTLLAAYGIQGYTIALNSLGCAGDKKALNSLLKEKLKPSLTKLCEDCRDRYDRNILRVLDCKDDRCREILEGVSIGHDHLCPECAAHFQAVKHGLDALGIAYEVMPRLVRGLDYYNRTVFEFKHPDLGPQQDALGAGGRYDGLVKELGGTEAGAIGFAFGVERLLLVTTSPCHQVAGSPLVYLVTLGDKARSEGMKLLHTVRSAGIAADTDYEHKSLKGAMRKAHDLGARCTLILGDDEIKLKAVALKDMKTGAQEKVFLDQLVSRLTELALER